MRRMWSTLVGPFTMMAAVSVLALPARAFDEVFDKSYHLDPKGSVELQNVNGSVQIMGWDRDTVEVHAVKKSEHNAADVSRVKIEVAAERNHLSVETHYPDDKSVEVSVEYLIHVPRHAELREIDTVNGKVSVRRVDSSGALRSVNGDVEILDSAGRFSAHTTNGDLHLEMRRVDRAAPLDAGTVNGSILIALAPNSSAALDVHTLNGEFQSDLPLRKGTSGDIHQFRGMLGRGGTTLALRTINGGIHIVALNPIL
jgi:DUF4097 and DUF4098 domain-containing protein YvlB